MPKEILYLLVLVLLIANTSAAPAEDEVKFPISGYNDHKWYSGYLNFTTGDFHYIFFDSQRDPDNDPVVLWLNGGPGCSSLIGLFLENGPFVFQQNSFDLKLNEFSWNKKANVLYIETPGTVGFSKGLRNNTYDDTTTAEDNYNALMDFFRKFPNLKKNEFYLSGESYAGIYVPYLALKIVQKNKLPETQTKLNFKGVIVGNPCTSRRQCYEPTYGGLKGEGMSIYQYQFLHNHAYITDQDYDYIRGACTLGYGSQGCLKIREKVNKFFESTNSVIHNIYQPCYHQHIPYAPMPKNIQGRRGQPRSYDTCQDMKGIMHFLNEPIMQINLHVQPRLYEICNEEVSARYTMNESASEWIYPILIKENIKVMIYSGDVDANVPITGTVRWINLLKDLQGWPVVEPWREWWVPGMHKHEDQVAGMVWKLRGLTFVSVKGAGHLAPRDKPKQTQVMFQSFIFNNDLPYKSQ